GLGRLELLRLLYRRRGLRFGSGAPPDPAEGARLFRRWLRERLPGLGAAELDVAPGLRRLVERLGVDRLLEAAWWRTLHLEVALEDGHSVHFLLEHRAGRLLRAEVLERAPRADLGLWMSERDLGRLYAADGGSG